MVEKLGASNGSMSRTTRVSPFAEKIHPSTWVVRSLNCTTNYYQLYHMHKTAISFQDSYIYIYIFTHLSPTKKKTCVFFFPWVNSLGLGERQGGSRWVVSSSSSPLLRCGCWWPSRSWVRIIRFFTLNVTWHIEKGDRGDRLIPKQRH